MCIFFDLRVCDWCIAAAAGSVCFLGEHSTEEEAGSETYYRAQEWPAGWGGAYTANRDCW